MDSSVRGAFLLGATASMNADWERRRGVNGVSDFSTLSFSGVCPL